MNLDELKFPELDLSIEDLEDLLDRFSKSKKEYLCNFVGICTHGMLLDRAIEVRNALRKAVGHKGTPLEIVVSGLNPELNLDEHKRIFNMHQKLRIYWLEREIERKLRNE